jgi:hypothetical protein
LDGKASSCCCSSRSVYGTKREVVAMPSGMWVDAEEGSGTVSLSAEESINKDMSTLKTLRAQKKTCWMSWSSFVCLEAFEMAEVRKALKEMRQLVMRQLVMCEGRITYYY